MFLVSSGARCEFSDAGAPAALWQRSSCRREGHQCCVRAWSGGLLSSTLWGCFPHTHLW
jgi:hypothetical protein